MWLYRDCLAKPLPWLQSTWTKRNNCYLVVAKLHEVWTTFTNKIITCICKILILVIVSVINNETLKNVNIDTYKLICYSKNTINTIKWKK